MKALLKYLEIGRVSWLNTVNHLVNVFARGGVVLIRIWIFTQLYTVTYRASGVELVGGLSVAQVIWSLVLVQSFQAATKPSVARMIEDEVKSGALAYSINRPYSYILFHFAAFLGRTGPTLIANLTLGGLSALFLVGPVRMEPHAIALALGLLFLGYVLDFVISLIIGLLTFWVEDNSGFFWLYHKGQMVFGGVILPIALFPENLRTIAELLPFSQMYYAASRIAVSWDAELFVKFLSIQTAWICVFSGIATLMFAKGVRNVSINGG